MSKARDLANAGTALTTVSATELGYLDGVTSAVQTQIDGKQAINANVSTTELGYLDGVTSAIQTQLDAKTAKSTLTTTGDIYYASSANTPARLGIGTSGQVLAVSSGIPAWATVASGSMTQIATGSFSGTSITISSIPATYKQLSLWILNIANSTGDASRIRFNGDTGTVYRRQTIESSIGYSPTGEWIDIPAANAGSFAFMNIPNYASTTERLKLTTGAGGGTSAGISLWNNAYYPSSTAAISSITMYTNSTAFTGSYILYGVN